MVDRDRRYPVCPPSVPPARKQKEGKLKVREQSCGAGDLLQKQSRTRSHVSERGFRRTGPTPERDHALLQEAERVVQGMLESDREGVRMSTMWLDKAGKPLVLLASRHEQDGKEVVDGFTDAEGRADFCEVQQMVHDTGIDLPQTTGDQRHKENFNNPFMEYQYTSIDGTSCKQGNPRHGLMPSKDAIGKNASTHLAATRYMHNMDRQSGLLNKLTERFFPRVHAKEQRTAAAGRWLKTRTSNTLGLATLYNVQTATHVDRHDRWCKLTNWGKYKGGMFYLPDLDLVLQYNPGDVVIFASHCLYHAIGPWTPLESKEGDIHLPGRVSWVHFNHHDVMELLEDRPADWMLNYGSNSTRM
ncbi:hypothetical protein BDZ89DRAFT_1051505 [Hymenopellis radicata]|nr:hypothetical protein BDZ89DRAFT_1051505 [Hymenopellis radicata]